MGYLQISGKLQETVKDNTFKLSEEAKIKNHYNQFSNQTQGTTRKSDKTQQNTTHKRANRLALSEPVTIRLLWTDKKAWQTRCKIAKTVHKRSAAFEHSWPCNWSHKTSSIHTDCFVSQSFKNIHKILSHTWYHGMKWKLFCVCLWEQTPNINTAMYFLHVFLILANCELRIRGKLLCLVFALLFIVFPLFINNGFECNMYNHCLNYNCSHALVMRRQHFTTNDSSSYITWPILTNLHLNLKFNSWRPGSMASFQYVPKGNIKTISEHT